MLFVTCGDTYAHAYMDTRTPARTVVSFSEMEQRWVVKSERRKIFGIYLGATCACENVLWTRALCYSACAIVSSPLVSTSINSLIIKHFASELSRSRWKFNEARSRASAPRKKKKYHPGRCNVNETRSSPIIAFRWKLNADSRIEIVRQLIKYEIAVRSAYSPWREE